MPVKLEIYVDSSFANGIGRKSIYVFLIMIKKAVVHYKSKQEPLVTQSSTEAEFVALSLTIKEVKWILSILDEMCIPVSAALIFCDNQGAIRIAYNKSSKGRTKHVDIRLQAMKEAVLNGEVKVGYVQSGDNVSDIFTRPLGRLSVHKLRDQMLTKCQSIKGIAAKT